MVPQGPFDLRVEPGRVEITLDHSLMGPGRFVFDQAGNMVGRDAEAIFPLDQVTGVEVQATWMGPGQPHAFLGVVLAAGNRTTYVCLHTDKQRVAEAMEAIGALVGLPVRYREQPFQRQVRELLGGAGGQTGVLEQGARAMRGCALVAQLLFLAFFMAAGAVVFGVSLAVGGGTPFTLAIGALFFVVPASMMAATIWRLVRRARRGEATPEGATGETRAAPPASPPRPAAPLNTWALMGRTGSLPFGLIFLAIGLMAWLGSLLNVATEVRYAVEGEVADGVIVEKRVARGKNTNHYATIRFRLPDGLDVEDEEQVDADRWRRLAAGARVRVSYLRSAPHQNRLHGETSWGEAFVLAAFGGIFGGVGGFLSWRAAHNVQLWRRLLREGALAEGTVVEVATTNVRINRQPRFVIRYQYTDPNGQPQQGRSHYLPPDEAERWRPGDVGEVRYDPRRPELSMWIGTLVERAEEPPREARAPSVWRPAAPAGRVADAPPAVPTPVVVSAAEAVPATTSNPAADATPPVPTPGPRLVFLTGPGAGKRAALDESPSVIGRSIAAEVAVDGDMKVGYQHARLTRGEQGWTVQEAAGSGGTWVNGERLSGPRALRDGDVIRVGGTELRFEDRGDG